MAFKRRCTNCGKEFITDFDWKVTCYECLSKKWLPPEKITETVHIAGQYPKRVYISTSRGCGKSEMMRQILEERLKKGDTIFTPWTFKLPEDIALPEEPLKRYCEADVEATKEILNNMYGIGIAKIRVKKLIFDYPATIVYWYDGTKTVVKCREGETFDKETGLF